MKVIEKSALGPGDVVKLKTGGPLMTVMADPGYTLGSVKCMWYERAGGRHVEYFHPATLVIASEQQLLGED